MFLILFFEFYVRGHGCCLKKVSQHPAPLGSTRKRPTIKRKKVTKFERHHKNAWAYHSFCRRMYGAKYKTRQGTHASCFMYVALFNRQSLIKLPLGAAPRRHTPSQRRLAFWRSCACALQNCACGKGEPITCAVLKGSDRLTMYTPIFERCLLFD